MRDDKENHRNAGKLKFATFRLECTFHSLVADKHKTSVALDGNSQVLSKYVSVIGLITTRS